MDEREIWERYLKVNPNAGSYSAWCFCGGGESGDRLADLVLRRIKTATASAYQIYQVEGSPIPKAGDLSIIKRSNGDAVCIIRTTEVEVRGFLDVTADHAFSEGEGDRTLEYWRMVHEEFFSKELGEKGLPFSEDMLVVCESFQIEFE